MSPPAIDSEPPQPARPGLLRATYARFQHLIFELGKFGTVGAVSFVVDTILYAYLLQSHQVETLTAKTLSTVVSATVAFIGNRFWTWRHRERSGLAREYTLYFLFNVVGLGIGLAAVAFSHYGLGSVWPHIFQTTLADVVAANLFGMAFGTLFRFWSYRRFVFPAARPTAEKIPQVEVATTDSSSGRDSRPKAGRLKQWVDDLP